MDARRAKRKAKKRKQIQEEGPMVVNSILKQCESIYSNAGDLSDEKGWISCSCDN